MRKRLAKIIKYAARKLRKDQTSAEALLWDKLRARQYKGYKFLRQHPISFEFNGARRFIVADFYCSASKLIIEIDGSVHENKKDYDRARDCIVKNLGLKVLRFDNDQLLNDIEMVLLEISNNLV